MIVLAHLLHRHLWINPISPSIALLRKRLNKNKVRKFLFLDIDGSVCQDKVSNTSFIKPNQNPNQNY